MNADAKNAILVTGGRGFLGRAVVKLLRRSTDSVISLDQVPTSPDSESEGQVVCDISDAAQLQRVFETLRVGGIIHLAAILPTAAQREPVRATQVNVVGSYNLLEMAWRFGVRRFVFGSSVSVYGTCPMDQVVSEETRAAPEDLYGAAKTYVEQLGQSYRELHGVEFVSLRIGRVVGPGAQSATSAWRSQIFELLKTKAPAEIELPYVASERIIVLQVDDVAHMLVTLLYASRLQYAVYNAPCESLVVGELKREVEALNSQITVKLGDRHAVGNPRLLDCNRFQEEFGFEVGPIFQGMKRAAGKDTRQTAAEDGGVTV